MFSSQLVTVTPAFPPWLYRIGKLYFLIVTLKSVFASVSAYSYGRGRTTQKLLVHPIAVLLPWESGQWATYVFTAVSSSTQLWVCLNREARTTGQSVRKCSLPSDGKCELCQDLRLKRWLSH